MKKIFVLSIYLLMCLLAFSTPSTKRLQAYLFYSSFYSSEYGPFVETYLSVVGSSVEFLKNENGKFQGTIEITMMFKLNNEIKEFKKYELLSPEITDTSRINFNFIDQQRFVLPDGNYEFDILISDKNTDMLPFVVTKQLTVDYPSDRVNQSGIELIESYSKTTSTNILTKSGYDLVPYVSNFYPSDVGRISFYSEVYNTSRVFGEGERFLLSYYIESFETNAVIPDFVVVKRELAQPINVVFNEFDIRKLPSGNYNLAIEVRDKKNDLVTSNKLFFQRSNPSIQLSINDIAYVEITSTFVTHIKNADTLAEYIRSLEPISSQLEINFANQITRDKDLTVLQKYFLNFWLTRDNLHPEDIWIAYNIEVEKAEQAFRTRLKKGYDTDRGRVYLKYGPPNSISESYHEPNAYPYEIWHYYELKNQRNKKFVFYSRELATNDFELIHSDAVGELSNYQWQFVIHERGNAPHGVDQDVMENHWGSKINDYYNNPR